MCPGIFLLPLWLQRAMFPLMVAMQDKQEQAPTWGEEDWSVRDLSIEVIGHRPLPTRRALSLEEIIAAQDMPVRGANNGS